MRFSGPGDRGDGDSAPKGWGERPRKIAPPPNYLQRGNQWRLLVLVGSLMLVLVLIEEARDPAHYRWMWGESSSEELEDPLSGRDLIEIKIRDNPSDQPAAVRPPPRLPLGAHDAWEYGVSRLTQPQMTAMRQRMFAARQAQPLPPEYHATADSALSELERAWKSYLAHARESIARGGEVRVDEKRMEEKATVEFSDAETSGEENPDDGTPVEETTAESGRIAREPLALLDRLERYWTDEVGPALVRARTPEASGDRLTEPYRVILRPLQQELDRQALAKVRDNTPFALAESEAWFRLIEQLRGGEFPREEKSATYASYIQLLDQSEVYRGKWVRVRGEARLGYRVDAPANDLGVEHYFVIWLKPEDGSNSPITIYSLELPKNFPGLADKTATGSMTELAESLDIGGVYFKRWAYRGERSLEIAPLILAGDLRWYPETSDLVRPVSRSDVVIAILGGILVGLLGLWVAWRTMHPAAPQSAGRHSSEQKEAGPRRRTLLWGLLAGMAWCGTVPAAMGFSNDVLRGDEDAARDTKLPWTRPDSSAARPELRDILELYGVVSSDLASLVAEETTAQRREQVLLGLLYYLPRLTPADWGRWHARQAKLSEFMEMPAQYRGTAITLRGRATQVIAHPVPPDRAETLEFSRYWEVTLELTDGDGNSLGQAKVFARQIPEAWQEEGELDEVGEMSGAFLDAVPVDQGDVRIVAATARFAWFPDRIRAVGESRAHPVRPESLALARSGVDHALWDGVRRRHGLPLDGPDRELFYQILFAAERQDTVDLAREYGQPMVLGSVLLRPREYQGALLTLTAYARRITRVIVEDVDIRERFGIDSYFQIDALLELEDQQIRLESRQPGREAVYADKFPMTFCTTQLPADLMEWVVEDASMGSERPLINERIEIAGFFLKTWPFRSEFLLALDPEQRHPSPLLLGTRPVRVPSPLVARDTPLELLLAGLFVLVLLGVTYGMWRWQKRQQHHLKTMRRSPQPGEGT